MHIAGVVMIGWFGIRPVSQPATRPLSLLPVSLVSPEPAAVAELRSASLPPIEWTPERALPQAPLPDLDRPALAPHSVLASPSETARPPLDFSEIISAGLDAQIEAEGPPETGVPRGTDRSDDENNPRWDGAHPVSAIRPQYPRNARREGLEGLVALRAEVGVNGEVIALTVTQSSGVTSLDQAALTAVQSAKFRPASRNGLPVPGIAILKVRFQLTDGRVSTEE